MKQLLREACHHHDEDLAVQIVLHKILPGMSAAQQKFSNQLEAKLLTVQNQMMIVTDHNATLRDRRYGIIYDSEHNPMRGAAEYGNWTLEGLRRIVGTAFNAGIDTARSRFVTLMSTARYDHRCEMSTLRQMSVDLKDSFNRLAFRRGDLTDLIGREQFDKIDFDYLTLLMVLDHNYSNREQGLLKSKLIKAEVVKALESARRDEFDAFKREDEGHVTRDLFDVAAKTIFDNQYLAEQASDDQAEVPGRGRGSYRGGYRGNSHRNPRQLSGHGQSRHGYGQPQFGHSQGEPPRWARQQPQTQHSERIAKRKAGEERNERPLN